MALICHTSALSTFVYKEQRQTVSITQKLRRYCSEYPPEESAKAHTSDNENG